MESPRFGAVEAEVMLESEFQHIVAQLVAVYDRDIRAVRQEVRQLKPAVAGHTHGPLEATARAPLALGPHIEAPQRPDAVFEAPADIVEAPDPPVLAKPMMSSHAKPVMSSSDVEAALKEVVSELEQMEADETASPKATRKSISRIGNLRIHKAEKTFWERLVTGPLEHVSGMAICLNVIFTLVQLQIRGAQLQTVLGMNNAPAVEDDTVEHVSFFIFEHMFNAFFLLELILRISILRCNFFRSSSGKAIQWFNIFDLLIVLFCSFELYLSTFVSQSESPMNLMFARILRLARLSRTLKVIQVMRAFSKLRILLKTVAASVLSFTWSMMILAVLNIGGAIFLCQMLQPTIADETLDLTLRLELFKMYGTSARAVWTMFEFTFSGGWPTYARPVIENVHWTFSFFFALYVSIVVFAVIRIITALFLKETLNVAARDADFMVQESMRAKREYALKLKELFELADRSGNGTIDLEEFNAICQIPEVVHYFHILELEISEVHALFSLLDNGDGQITYEEFVSGIVRLKGTARSMDVLTMMRDCDLINARCRRLEEILMTLQNDRASKF